MRSVGNSRTILGSRIRCRNLTTTTTTIARRLSYSEGKGGRIIDNLQADTYKLITFRQAGAVAVVNLLYSINTLCRPDLTTTEQPADSTFFFGSGSSFRLKWTSFTKTVEVTFCTRPFQILTLYRPEYQFTILH